MKYCPSCGKAGVEGMKSCPQCGQRLTRFDLEENQRYVYRPEAPLKKRNWFERHLNWTLLLVIIGAPFILFWIVFGLVNLIALFSVNIAAWIFDKSIPVMPIAVVAMIVVMVRWYKEKRRQGKTMTNYSKDIALDPDNADAYYKRGEAYGEMGEYGKAIADYNKAIELDPNHALAYYNRGCAYDELGEYGKAIANYHKAIELDPGDAYAYYNRGDAYREKGELARAVSDLKKCIRLTTDPKLTKTAQQALYKIKNPP